MLQIASRSLTSKYFYNIVNRNLKCFTQRNFTGLCNQNIYKRINDKNNNLLIYSNKSSELRRYASNDAVVDLTFLGTLWQNLSTSTPVAYLHQTLLNLHDDLGISWWATIVLTTILYRSLITLVLTIYQQKITARIELISIEMKAIIEELKKEASIAMKQYNWTERETQSVYLRSVRKQWNKLVIRDNCHPFKTFIVVWAQIPLWVFQSMALRNIIYMQPNPLDFNAQLAFTQMTVGGFGWIPNLTEVDSSYILPITLGLLNLSIIEIQSMLRTKQSSRFQIYSTNTFRVLSLAMIPIACTVPSGLCLYWVTSSSYGLMQNLMLVSPKVRRFLGIPITPSEISNPYQHLWSTVLLRTGQTQSVIGVEEKEKIKNKNKEKVNQN